jgi:DNA polymerase III subunit gamma/tau
MAYEVFARKWRPQQFDQVVGQDHITRTLINAIKNNRVAHSYLFVGQRGTGKTSIARIFAKALNCEKGITDHPCDKCDSCREIASGNSLDVQEIDGASNRGIDEIRALKDTIQYMPNARFKIYIIDEVHMLTTEAFNALLKTLEEPPENIKFFFATTEPQKVPATILSRCQRFNFRQIPVDLLIKRLSEIAKSENVTIEKSALMAAARVAEGSMRDAESALDQVISFKGNEISEQDVVDVFGLVPFEAMEMLISAILKGEIPTIIKLIEQFDKQGKDMQQLVVEILEYCRNLLLFLHAQNSADSLPFSSLMIKNLKKQVELTSPERLLRITDILMNAYNQLRYALSKKTLIETTLIRCAEISVTVPITQILSKLDNLKKTIKQESAVSLQKSSDIESQNSSESHNEDLQSDRDKSDKDKLLYLKNNWNIVTKRMFNIAPLAKSYLQNAVPVKLENGIITIGIDSEFSDKITEANNKRNVNALQKVIQSIIKDWLSVEFTVIEKTQTNNENTQKTEQEHEQSKKKDNELENTGLNSIKDYNKWYSNKFVKKIQSIFDCSIIDIRE